MPTIKTYSKGAPSYNALIRHAKLIGMWLVIFSPPSKLILIGLVEMMWNSNFGGPQ